MIAFRMKRKNDDTPAGRIHGALELKNTLCGLEIKFPKWQVDGHGHKIIDCPKCLKLIDQRRDAHDALRGTYVSRFFGMLKAQGRGLHEMTPVCIVAEFFEFLKGEGVIKKVK